MTSQTRRRRAPSASRRTHSPAITPRLTYRQDSPLVGVEGLGATYRGTRYVLTAAYNRSESGISIVVEPRTERLRPVLERAAMQAEMWSYAARASQPMAAVLWADTAQRLREAARRAL